MPRETLVFGQGVDRATGATVADPASPQDLFNMYAREMKLALRPGLSGTPFAPLEWGTDILAIAPLRATKDILFAVLDRASGDVRIYRMNPISADTLHQAYRLTEQLGLHPKDILSPGCSPLVLHHLLAGAAGTAES